MTRFRMIGAAVLSLAFAGPAMAEGSYGMHRIHRQHDGRIIHRMPVRALDHFDFYQSGRPGPSPEYNYQGTTDDDVLMPPTANGG